MNYLRYFIASLLLLTACFMQPVSLTAQNKTTVIETKGTKLPDLFKTIERQTNAKIIFFYEDVSAYTFQGSLDISSAESAVIAAISGLPLTCRVDGQYIYIDKKDKTNAQPVQHITISGKVVDKSGEPLPGVTVMSVGTNRGWGVGSDGMFLITGEQGMPIALNFRYIGMKSQTINFDGSKNVTGLRIVMEDEENELADVVVNGMFERKASTFTGSVTTFSQQQLLDVSNQNLVKSLATLDPALDIIENVAMGSNPNSLPTIQLRGETSFNIQGDYDGNANEPLFIVDGFESTLEKVYDLDMARIESVTILKDASAKAVYGSKAGNGVVVIQTIRPKTGEVRISYNGSLAIEAPDLSGYNLMNAKEKYQWEIEHDKFANWQSMVSPYYADLLQKSVEDAIASGIDTYWLSKPLRSGIGHKHSVSLEGGDARVRYILGASYNDIEGVMKGSNRQTYNINSSLSYSYKNMVFRNLMDFSNNKSNESPYGQFSEYVVLEPYFAPYDKDGNLKPILGYQAADSNGFRFPQYNPMYNASINTKNQQYYTTFSDNFDMDWHINDQWRFTAQFSYTHTNSGGDIFYPSNHTKFIDYTDENGLLDRRGEYTQTTGKMNMFTIQTGINYNLMLGKHALFANATWNAQISKSDEVTVVAEGFGNDNMDAITMATYYQRYSAPYGSDANTREVGFVGSLNYSYDDRYLLDVSVRESGSSVYGANNHWGTFWSAGAGWNLHNESWFKNNAKDITLLKLRYSIGYTGTQNFNPYQARAKYEYGDIIYDGRYGTTIMGIPNYGLKWQRVLDSNLGLDVAYKNMLTMRVEYYVQQTDNMLSDITLPASTGFLSYKANMGQMKNRGVEFSVGYTPWRNNAERAWVSISATGQHYKNKITKIYDLFKKANDDSDAILNQKDYVQLWPRPSAAEYIAQTTRPKTKYYEGCSMTAIWGVRSLGIDPISGNELFRDKNGDLTYIWSSDDQVVIGDYNPALRGTFSISGGWRGWTLSLVAQYKFGGDMYNSSLIDRVENVTGMENLDKRVAYTWNKVGQIAAYRKIEMRQSVDDLQYSTTRPTSRFVQKDNELYFSTLNIGYDFYNTKWLSKTGLERLKLNFYCNELARFNAVKVERGLSYPFARTFTFSVGATF